MRYAQITWVDRDHMIKAIKTLRQYFDTSLLAAKISYDMVDKQVDMRHGAYMTSSKDTFDEVMVVVPLPEDFDDTLVIFKHIEYKVITS